MDAKAPWIALAATPDLPIAEEPVAAAAGGRYEVRTVPLPYRPLDAEETARWAGAFAGAGGVLLRSGYATAELLDLLPDLRVVAVHGAGVDPVDLAACAARGVTVTNTPGANANAVAELAVALMLSLLRGIPDAAHRARNEKAWDAARHTGGELRGRTLGLVGLGRIGARVAAIARAFGARTLAHDPALADGEIAARGAEPAGFEALLAASDIISLHAPATPETHRMIDAAAIARTRPGALLVNCARGSLVDEAALADALGRGRLGGAALDVLDGEPPDPASPVYGAPNLVLTPHMAGSTRECLREIAAVAGADIVRVLDGEAPLHPVGAPGAA